MNLKDIMLNERKQTLRSHTVWFYFSEVSRIGKSTETERLVVTTLGRGGAESNHEWAQGFLVGDENVLELVVMVVQPCEYTKHYWLVHFKVVNFIIEIECDHFSVKLLLKNKTNKKRLP